MFTHKLATPTKPERVVTLGAHGFLASELRRTLDKAGVSYVALSSKELDLIDVSAADRLAAIVKPGDTVVFLSALTPDKGRDNATLMKNVRMGENVCAFLAKTRCAHLIYVSSDGIYDSRLSLVNEDSSCETGDL